MPVVGLLTALESALVTLLNDKLLRSWKITEENTPWTAIDPQRDSAAIAQCSYRRRPPSRLKRDKKRAEEFQQKKLSSPQEIQASDANTDAVFDRDFFSADTTSFTI